MPPDTCTTTPTRTLCRWSSLGLLLIVSLAYAWLFPWSEKINNPNEMVRVYAVRAVVDDHTYAIARRTVTPQAGVQDHSTVYDAWGYVNDKALRCDDPAGQRPNCTGHLYAGKAPGLTFLGVPVYAAQKLLWRLLGQGEPSKAWIVWWLRFFVVIVPSILGWLWLARHLTGRLRHPELGLAAVLAGALGSLSLTYSQMFAGHQVSGLFLLLQYAATMQAGLPQAETSASRKWLVLAGFGAAAAACTEFPAGPAAILLGLWLLVRRRQVSDIGWLVLGAALPTLLLGHHNQSAFGKPWALPYAFLENPDFVRDIAPGIFGISLPNAEKVVGSLLSPFTGLYFWAPWVVLTWLALVRVFRPQVLPDSMSGTEPVTTTETLWTSQRGEALMAFAVVGYFLFFQTSHSLWRGGWVVGPRYITALVPFAVIAVAHGLDGLPGRFAGVGRSVFASLAVTAIAVTGLASAVSQGFPFEVYNPLPEVVGPLLARGWVFWSPLQQAKVPGLWSGLPYFAALAAGALWLVWLAAKQQRPRWLAAVSSVLVALALTSLLWRQTSQRTAPDRNRTVQFLMDMWFPGPVPGASRLPVE